MTSVWCPRDRKYVLIWGTKIMQVPEGVIILYVMKLRMKRGVDGRVEAMMVNPALTGPGIWWWNDSKLNWHVKWGLVNGAMDISIIGGVIEWIYLKMLKVVNGVTTIIVVDDFENWIVDEIWYWDDLAIFQLTCEGTQYFVISTQYVNIHEFLLKCYKL